MRRLLEILRNLVRRPAFAAVLCLPIVAGCGRVTTVPVKPVAPPVPAPVVPAPVVPAPAPQPVPVDQQSVYAGLAELIQADQITSSDELGRVVKVLVKSGRLKDSATFDAAFPKPTKATFTPAEKQSAIAKLKGGT